jgi:hypothetical protein
MANERHIHGRRRVRADNSTNKTTRPNPEARMWSEIDARSWVAS